MPLMDTPQKRGNLARALRLMGQALDILDRANAPGAIGSTLDLAAARLQGLLDEGDGAPGNAPMTMAELERDAGALAAGGNRPRSQARPPGPAERSSEGRPARNLANDN